MNKCWKWIKQHFFLQAYLTVWGFCEIPVPRYTSNPKYFTAYLLVYNFLFLYTSGVHIQKVWFWSWSRLTTTHKYCSSIGTWWCLVIIVCEMVSGRAPFLQLYQTAFCYRGGILITKRAQVFSYKAVILGLLFPTLTIFLTNGQCVIFFLANFQLISTLWPWLCFKLLKYFFISVTCLVPVNSHLLLLCWKLLLFACGNEW